MDAWHFSIDISFNSPRYLIGIFIWMPGIVNRYFILLPRIFHGAFHMDAGYFQWIFHSWPQDISLHISYGCLEFSIDISFCSPGYFIGIFIWMPGIFQLIFHSIPQDIS
jgi:hypothetical protein